MASYKIFPFLTKSSIFFTLLFLLSRWIQVPIFVTWPKNANYLHLLGIIFFGWRITSLRPLCSFTLIFYLSVIQVSIHSIESRFYGLYVTSCCQWFRFRGRGWLTLKDLWRHLITYQTYFQSKICGHFVFSIRQKRIVNRNIEF